MVLSPGAKNIPIRKVVMDRVTERWLFESDTRSNEEVNTRVGGFVNDLLERILKKYEFISQYLPNICYIGFAENKMILRDSDIAGNVIEIMVKKNRLYCNFDHSGHCIHVMYAIALPEVTRFNIHGFKYHHNGNGNNDNNKNGLDETIHTIMLM